MKDILLKLSSEGKENTVSNSLNRIIEINSELKRIEKEITLSDIINNFSYVSDKEDLQSIIDYLNSIRLYDLANTFSQAKKELALIAYPEKLKVQYYKDILDGINFLSESQLIWIDKLFESYGRRYYFNKYSLLKLKAENDIDNLFLNEAEVDRFISHIINSKKVLLLWTITCPECSEELVDYAFDLEDKPTIERVMNDLDGDIYCEDECDCHYLDLRSKEFLEDEINNELVNIFEKNNYSNYKFRLKNKPNYNIRDL